MTNGDSRPEADCSLCKRSRELISMVRVISAAERIEEDFCDWDCMWRYFHREYGCPRERW